jgi:hypothetical protein
MLLAFQILLFVLIVLFSLGLMSHDTKENKQTYAAVVISSVIAMVVCFYIG